MARHHVDAKQYASLYEEMNKLFKEIFRFDPSTEKTLEMMEIPPVDIYETAGDVVLEIEVPGIDPDKVQVSFTGGRLIVEGTKEEDTESGRQNYLCMERSFGRFQRVIPLNRAVDLRRTRASYRLGIITIKLPKMQEKRGERIVIPLEKAEAEGKDG